MRFISVVLLFIPAWSAAQTSISGGKSAQSSSGNCSPNIVNNGSGSVTVNATGACSNLETQLVRKLGQQLKTLTVSADTISNLNLLIQKQGVELADKVKEVDDWARRYSELVQQFKDLSAPDEEIWLRTLRPKRQKTEWRNFR